MVAGTEDSLTVVKEGTECGAVRPSVPSHTEEGPQQDRMRATQREAEQGLREGEQKRQRERCTLITLCEVSSGVSLKS